MLRASSVFTEALDICVCTSVCSFATTLLISSVLSLRRLIRVHIRSLKPKQNKNNEKCEASNLVTVGQLLQCNTHRSFQELRIKEIKLEQPRQKTQRTETRSVQNTDNHLLWMLDLAFLYWNLQDTVLYLHPIEGINFCNVPFKF